jgi:hypothetical protein
VELEFLHKSKESPNTDTYAQNKKSAPQKIYPLTVRESKGKVVRRKTKKHNSKRRTNKWNRNR